jgi:pimeloyl-ACP methyl ester carboxylesterase
VPDVTAISPDGYSLANFYLAVPGAAEIQLDLSGDYKTFLAVWGKNDPFFLPSGAEAFRRDIPGAIAHFFDTGHFALETHANEIAAMIRDFLAR